MARKRMLDPNFWGDLKVRKLTPIERLFFLGCISAADDEGRLIGDPAWLRSQVFPYDDDISVQDVEGMRDHIAEVVSGFVVYQDDGEVYVAFRKWGAYQKPSYAKPSSLPRPPFVPHSSEKDEASSESGPSFVPPSSESGPQDSIGQYRSVKDRLGNNSAPEGANDVAAADDDSLDHYFDQLGIEEGNKRNQLAALPHVTPELLREWRRWKNSGKRRLGVGWIITRIEAGEWP